jgi:tRNA (guanine6-N2)-methyltransferase
LPYAEERLLLITFKVGERKRRPLREIEKWGMTMRYFCTVPTGLERVTLEEIRQRFPSASSLEPRRGKVLFNYDGPAFSLFTLRSVNHLCLVCAEWEDLPLDETGLTLLKERSERIDLLPAIEVVQASGLLPRWPPSFRVTAERSGNHSYHSPQIASAVGAGIQKRYGWRVDLEHFDLEVKVFVTDHEVLMGIALTREGLQRRDHQVYGRASLKPPVAFALVWLAGLEQGMVLVDPMCGTGTILIEAGREYEGIYCLGGDISSSELRKARLNIESNHLTIPLVQWNAVSLPLKEGSVHRVVTNPPWGRRIGSHQRNRKLYPSLLREVHRILTPAGRLVFISLESRLIERCLEDLPFLRLLRRPFEVNVGGLWPKIYILEKRLSEGKSSPAFSEGFGELHFLRGANPQELKGVFQHNPGAIN